MRKAIVALLTAAVCSASLINIAPAHASTYTEEQYFIYLINNARTSRGLHALKVRSDLTYYARKNSNKMAYKREIFHDSNLKYEVHGWYCLGQNVGRGYTVNSIEDAFMASDTHRSIILYRYFDSVGVGVAHAGGRIYVTENFGDF